MSTISAALFSVLISTNDPHPFPFQIHLRSVERPVEGGGRDCCDVTNPMAAEPSTAPSPSYLGFLLLVQRLLTTLANRLVILAKEWEGFFYGSFAAN
jgi:hypothetical protein